MFYLLLKLKLRHLQTAFNFMVGGMLGVDFVRDRNLMERLYQASSLVLVSISLALLWVYLLDRVAYLFLSLGTEATIVVFQTLLFVIPGIFIFLTFRALRSSPITLNSADITYIIASPIKSLSIVMNALLSELISFAVVGFLTGYLTGVSLEHGLQLPLPVLNCSLLCMLFALLVLMGSWVVGVWRLSGTKARSYALLAASGVAMLLAVAVPLLLVMSEYLTSAEAILNIFTRDFLVISVSALIAIAAEFATLKIRASALLMDRVVHENALYAEMHSLRYLPLYDMSGYKELRRRTRVQNRKPKIHLPLKSGVWALLLRACLSHLRQYEGLFSLLLWGAFAAPSAVYLLLNVLSPGLWLLWIAGLLAFSARAREITRVFRDDVRNVMMRSRLPFSTFKLLIYDSLPAFTFVSLVSAVVISVLLSTNPLLFWGLLVSLSLNMLFALCASLEGLKITARKHRLSAEVVLGFCALLLFAVVFTGSLIAMSVAICLLAFGLCAILRFSTE